MGRHGDPAKSWLTFLQNHRERDCGVRLVHGADGDIPAALLLLCDPSRSAVHPAFQRHAAFHDSLDVQQLREAFPFGSASRFLIFDRDGKYGLEVPAAVRALNISPVRTSFESPWQNGVAERWVETCRRDLLDHIIAINERHLKRLLADYVRYYHDDRTHLGLGKGTPDGRIRAAALGRVVSDGRLGGLHHRYDRAA